MRARFKNNPEHITMKRRLWCSKRVPLRQIILVIVGLAAAGVFGLLWYARERIPGSYQDAIETSLPLLLELSLIALAVGSLELYFNRWRRRRHDKPDLNGEALLNEQVEKMCARYDAWRFGKDTSGASTRYADFIKLVGAAKVYNGNKMINMETYLDEDGNTLVIKTGKNPKHNLHELVHIYQQVAWGILSREREGRITLEIYVRAELEATWFAGQWVWTLLWIVCLLAAVICIVWYAAYNLM